ncbi:uncharacterized protein [Mycetomoellerius zeteki]|uniref:uncharacterized protein n=1 Tax=Mycetomoellerius zeteki TaxID=64791 RepID=UPI00084E5D95|nr:PREDICTED: uncharacterized protein LOC108729657 [Trachymyrmex zeteki]
MFLAGSLPLRQSHLFLISRYNTEITTLPGEYIASHNETATNISSTLFPKASVCIHENRTYSVGENIVRDCEEKCICSESGITNCQPLCIYPYVKVGRELKDHLCQEKLVAEEPCALIFCPAGSGKFALVYKVD